MHLAAHPFFDSFPSDTKQQFLAVADLISIAESHTLFREGDPSDSLFLVLEGAVNLVKSDTGEHPLVIATLAAGDYFGELGLLDGSPRSTGAEALAGSRLGKIEKLHLDSALKNASAETFRAIFSRVSQRLRQTNDLLLATTIHQEKMALVGEMASGIIHDFRNPFTIIGLAQQMIEDRHTDPDTSRFCAMINNQITLMTGMMNEILAFSKGTSHLECTPVDIPKLFALFESQNQLAIQNKPIDLQVIATEATLICDREKILRVLQNLFNNAVDAFQGKPGRVVLLAAVEKEDILLSLSDNGPGIPEAIRSTLFEPFVSKNKSSGTGLGLAIAKSTIQAHGGHITVETTTAHGTTFHIRLPRNASA